MEEQKYLFEILKTKIPSQYRMPDVLEDLLGVGKNAVYCRIRGETELSFSELLTICRTYNLSMDEIFNMTSNQGALFRYAPVNFTEPGSYINYLHRLSGSLAYYKSAKEIEMRITAQDIPFFYFLVYPDLMFFKLYAWNDTVSRASVSFEKFCSNLDQKTIIPIYREMANAWQLIPSKEIWTDQTMDTILRLLEYYFEIGAFEKKETALSLTLRLTELMNDIKKNVDKGYKGNQTPFQLYLCSVDFENNFMLIKREGNISCTIRLFTVNSMVTEQKGLCAETEKWIDDLILKSNLISGTSAKERTRFFNTSSNKIDTLIEKISKMKT